MKIACNLIGDSFKRFLTKNRFWFAFFMLLMAIGIVAIPRIFAELQPVKSIEIFSEKLDYNSKEPGSWKVTKSAKWISKGEAEITFDVDSIMKTNNKNTDVLLVLDVSSSMDGDKLSKVKADSIELIESLLSNDKNKVGLITFDSTSEIISDFTNDKEMLINSMNNLSTKGATNYYKALISVDSILNDYVNEKDTECKVLFLTDGYPCYETPNEVGQYSYLKNQYPFVTINGIQYEMGTNVLDSVKKVSDNQFIADMDTLNNVLFDASVTPIIYDNFELTDYIDTNYFYVEDESKIKVSQGNTNFDKTNQKVTWNVSKYRSGSKIKMTIKLSLKNELNSQEKNYSTNKKEEIKSKIDETIEDITSTKTPVLTSKYKVTYDANVPDGCNIIGDIPGDKSYSIFDTVELSDNSLKSDGYQFRGWEITTKGVVSINGDYFTMPEDDVVIRAKWSKLSINKSMDGEVREYIPATLEKYGSDSTYGLHKYKSSITDIIFQDSMSSIGGAIDVLDISSEKNNGILAYIVPNVDDATKYTAYIQGDGGVVANSNSGYLFYNFTNLKSVQKFEYLDTSKVTDMTSMFRECSGLTTLNLSSFDTSNVTGMISMFFGCSSLINLNLSNFNTQKVAMMCFMFSDCSSLTNLDLSSFDTSKVIMMYSMFDGCSSLTSLELRNFDTSSVTDMNYLFSDCSSLTSIDLSSFDTSKVIDMGGMFLNCSSLTSVNANNFDTSNVVTMNKMWAGCSSMPRFSLTIFKTSKVVDMTEMFNGCSSATIIDLSSFDTSSVTNMKSMFKSCSNLTSLNLNSFDTSKVTDMSSMFYDCEYLTNLNLSNFDTSSATKMSSMFFYCRSLTSLNLSSFIASRVTDMNSMFQYCHSLTSLDVSSFDTSSVTDMSSMFSWCNSLTSLDVSNFDTSSVTDMSFMFSYCSSLTSLDVSNFDISSVTDMSLMFRDCGKLTTSIIVANTLTNYTNMFIGAATEEGAKITVNYTENVADVIDDYIATKSTDSNVVKGEKVPEYTITISGNDDIVSDCTKAFADKTVKLNSKSGNFKLISFKMNGALINGNKFRMPAENVSITDITVVEMYIIESVHGDYPNNLDNKIYGEKTFDGATSLTVELDYQTESTNYDWIYLYDSTGKSYGKYGGTTRRTETIIIPGNYIKITFRTDSSGNSYYGFKAEISPNYD